MGLVSKSSVCRIKSRVGLNVATSLFLGKTSGSYCGVSEINNISLTKSIFYSSTLFYNSTQISYREIFVLKVFKLKFLPLCTVQRVCNLGFRTEFRLD